MSRELITKLAKKLKKEKGITHMQALESIVKSLGYKSWNHYCKWLKEQTQGG